MARAQAVQHPAAGRLAPHPAGGARRGSTALGTFRDEQYLWLLVALELAATALLRQRFRNAHGG